MAKRHRDALGIVDPGAINPSGISSSIFEACREVRGEGGDTQRDPAIRLMVHQLAHVCGVPEMDRADNDAYATMLRVCRERVEADRSVSMADALLAGRAS